MDTVDYVHMVSIGGVAGDDRLLSVRQLGLHLTVIHAGRARLMHAGRVRLHHMHQAAAVSHLRKDRLGQSVVRKHSAKIEHPGFVEQRLIKQVQHEVVLR